MNLPKIFGALGVLIAIVFIMAPQVFFIVDETNQVIIKAPPSLIRGWTSDDRSAIYSSGGRCLIRRGLPFADDVGCAIRVSQPVLLLKVPDDF